VGCIACAALVLDGAGVELTRKESSTAPLVAGSISPDRIAGLGQTEIAELPILCEGEEVPLGEHFEVDGPGAAKVTLRGDLSNVERIGQGMTMGRLTVTRIAGPLLGSGMSGGEIVAERDVGDRLGAGMSGGLIVVDGSAGREAGAQMHGGLIALLGDAGEAAGEDMDAGTIVVAGRLGERPGSGMKGGVLVTFGGAPVLPPAFRAAGPGELEFLKSHLPALEATGLVTGPWIPEGEFRRFVGDAGSGGEGEVLVRAESE
jgi:formylmethanofuran dehydrogenase subunit C